MFSLLCSANFVSDAESLLSFFQSQSTKVTAPLSRRPWRGTRDKPNNVCVGGYRCDWFVTSSYEFDDKKQLDHESIIIFPFTDSICYSYFIKSIEHSFYRFTGAIKKSGSPSSNGSRFSSFSCVLPTFRVVCYASKPIERVVYCLNKVYP